ncbi:hypothetical protein MLD38_007103 [Melastoma candidum]|uniref:Uncharacterized protein n=1 Tax=Melastoma candidum TaxID=119954 RepID=A0ACB9RRY6_9MYRT|nr:hypothetical protein MLD38_007103 [Melastoma candidum]
MFQDKGRPQHGKSPPIQIKAASPRTHTLMFSLSRLYVNNHKSQKKKEVGKNHRRRIGPKATTQREVGLHTHPRKTKQKLNAPHPQLSLEKSHPESKEKERRRPETITEREGIPSPHRKTSTRPRRRRRRRGKENKQATPP